jgi:hypothetical protein
MLIVVDYDKCLQYTLYFMHIKREAIVMTVRINKPGKQQNILAITLLLLSGILPLAHADDEAPQPNLPKYEIVKKATDAPFNLGFYSELQHYEYGLKLEDSTEVLFLARGFEGLDYGVIQPVYGFDPDSFKLEWVLPNELVLGSWGTVPRGQGGYIRSSYLLIEKDGGDWRTIYRDSIEGGVHFSVCSGECSSIEFSSNDINESFLLTFTEESSWCWYEHRDKDASTLLTTRWEQNDGNVQYAREECRIKRYPFTIENGAAVIGSGKESFDLEDQEFPLKDVAEFLSISEDQLIAMNPRLKDTTVCSGEFLIRENIPPRKPDTDHYYTGGDPQ